MHRRNSRSRGAVQTPGESGASIIPLRRVRAAREAAQGQARELGPVDEGMAALARLLAEAWAY